MNDAKTSFLGLPVEVRLQIYHLALAPSRLCTRPILDPEWLFSPDRGCKVEPLIFASKQIYQEAAPIFYAKATLEVTPCQRDPTDGRKLTEFARQYEEDHAFCPALYLQCVETVHVYGDQTWPVDQDAFQAMFQWVVSNTAVKYIYLSRKTMQQGRHIPELICLNNLIYDMKRQQLDTRIIDIYARNVSSRLRFCGNSLTNRAKPLPDVQLYLSSISDSQTYLWREPRWDILLRDSDELVDQEVLLKQEMARFASGYLGDVYLRQAHSDGYLWLYKTIQIQRNPRRCSMPPCATISQFAELSI